MKINNTSETWLTIDSNYELNQNNLIELSITLLFFFALDQNCVKWAHNGEVTSVIS